MAFGRVKTGGADIGPALDSIRLALGAVADAPDLGSALQQLCVGATRVTGSSSAFVLLERGGRSTVAAAVGDSESDEVGALIRELTRGERVSGRPSANAMIVPLHGDVANGALVAHHPRDDSRAALELFGEAAATLVDLRVLRDQAANAAHRVQPGESLAGVLASIRAGDGVLVVAVDDLDGVRRRGGDVAGEAVNAGAGAHLLNATRPPGDVIVSTADGQFLVVLRDLKAPIETVAQRLLDTWLNNRPSSTLSLGAALHLDGSPPLSTLERAEDAVASAMALGGGRAHISPR